MTVLLLATTLSGCFTGIESTPKITARDVKRQHATVTPEMTYARDVTGDPVASWTAGKQFIVTEGKISFALTPVDIADRLNPGDTITYIGTRRVPSMTDVDDSLLMFLTARGDTLNYRLQETPGQLAERPTLEIPFTIEASLVDKASSLLAGNDYYITTPVWFNDSGDNITGRKLIKVHIDRVIPGDSRYPLIIEFTDVDGNRSRVYMSVGTGRRSTRNFDTLFSLTDPRLRYKDIKDDVWECITRSTVKPEMTREECRLSLGNPRDVVRGHYLERWTYDNGVSLIFDDGYLRDIRR